MRKCILFVVSIWLIQLTILAQSRVIEISPEQGKDNENLMLALEKAAGYKGKPVTVRLSPGIYELDRRNRHKCYITYRIPLPNQRILIQPNISDYIFIH